MKKSSILAVGIAALLGVSACSSDNKLTVTTSTSNTEASGDDTSSGSSADDGGSVSVPDLSGIPGISDECATYVQAIASAFTPSGEGVAGLSGSFEKLQSVVPDALKDDVKTLSEAFAKLQTLYEKYDNDYSKIGTDPEFTKLFSDSKFTEASNNLNEWLDTQCPQS